MSSTEESDTSGPQTSFSRTVVYEDGAGTQLPAESVLAKVLQNYIFEEPSLDDPDLAIASMIPQIIIAEGISPQLEAILMLNEELFTVLMGLVYAGLKAKNTELMNKLELKILVEENKDCDEPNSQESSADIDNSDN
jgi:hypothetical protein